MRPAIFRFTIRRSMAVVAIVAIVMALGITAKRLKRLRAGYQKRAMEHARVEQEVQSWLNFTAKQKDEMKKGIDFEIPPMDAEIEAKLKAELSDADQQEMRKFHDETARELGQLKGLLKELERIDKVARLEIAYHAGLKKKYQRAADHPWESVTPDVKELGYHSGQLMKMSERALTKYVTELGEDLRRQTLPPGLEMIGTSTEAGTALRAEEP